MVVRSFSNEMVAATKSIAACSFLLVVLIAKWSPAWSGQHMNCLGLLSSSKLATGLEQNSPDAGFHPVLDCI